jgi:REP element-mobilizing transposase RayT
LGRPWREEYNGGIYHVIARGNNKEYIFKESIDKGYFIKLLKENMEGMSYRIYGYVLTDNHYHLILQVFNKKLQEIMHQINNKYSKYFNFKYKRVGHVFQGRYKAILVQDERYLLSVLRYVHQNPIKAGMCKNIEEYKWCSDAFYRTNNNNFINIDTVLDMLSGNRKDALSKYREYMKQEEQMDYDNVKVVGEEAYQIMCSAKKKVEQKKRLDEILIGLGIS